MDDFFSMTVRPEQEENLLEVCNSESARFGLVLTRSDMLELEQSRREALYASGRIEFGGGVLPKLVRAFCDSPYILQEDYAETLGQLQEVFYQCKTECGDSLTDVELIGIMAEHFNGKAHGSVDYLAGTSLEELIRGCG